MRRGRRQGCRICLSIAIRQLCRARGDTHGACVLLAQHAAAARAKGISHPVRRQWLSLADTSGWTIRTVRHDDRHTEAIRRYTPAGTDCNSCWQLLHKGVAGADLAPDAVHSRVPGASLLHPSMECAPKRSASGSNVRGARHGMRAAGWAPCRRSRACAQRTATGMPNMPVDCDQTVMSSTGGHARRLRPSSPTCGCSQSERHISPGSAAVAFAGRHQRLDDTNRPPRR